MSVRVSRLARGMTLIELIVFIVIVSVGLTGVLLSLNTSVKGSADPLRPKQALAIAEGLLEEILLKGYCDPDTIDTSTTPPTCGTNGTESRTAYDGVQDFDSTGTGTVISTDAAGNAWPSGYTPTVTVSTVNLGPSGNTVSARMINVSVNYGGSSAISLTGYRTNY